MIIPNIGNKKAQLTKIFSLLKLSFNEQLIKDSQNIIRAYEAEKDKDFNAIDLIYTPTTKVTRYSGAQGKTTPPYHMIDGQWKTGIGNINNWLPYGNQDIKFCLGEIALIHEGEKACDYARSCGLISFAFCGAKSQNEEFLKNQLLWLKSQGLKGSIYISDYDKQGEEKGNKLIKIANSINFPLIVIGIDKILYPVKKSDDFADLVMEFKKRYKFYDETEQIMEIRKYLEKTIEHQLEEFIDENLEKIANIKITAEEAKDEVELLYQQEIEEADLIIQIDHIYHRLAVPMTKGQWQRLCKSIRQKYRYDRIKLEIQRYLQESDRLKQIDIKNQVCSWYGYSNQDFYKLVDYLDNLERVPQKQFWSVDDLVEARKERQNWLIPSFLPQGELLMLAAKSKVGKSLLATEIANKIITGGEFLGEKVNQGKVLYTFSDESQTDFGDRIFNLGIDLLANKNDLIGCSFLDLMNLRAFEEQLDLHRPKLVIIDSLTSTGFNIPFTENEAGFAVYLYRLKDLLKKYNCSCILIHHNNKTNEISGSERLKAACWGTAQMTTEQGTIVNEDEEQDNEWSEDYRFLIMNHTRSTEPAKYKLLLNPSQQWIEKGIYEFCGEASDPTGEKREAADKILRFLKNNRQPHEVMEINHYLGIPNKTIYKALDRLCRRGEVEKRRSANNPKCWVFEYIKNNSQQGILTQIQNKDFKNSQIGSPPPLENNHENENLEAETIADKAIAQILTTFSREDDENDVRISYNQDEVIDTDDKKSFSPNSQRGGGDQNDLVVKSDFQNLVKIPYCESISFIGAKVTHKDSPDIQGEILSNPKEVINNFTVKVKWEKPRKGYRGLINEETCYITCLINEKIDFKLWREEKLNA